MIKTPQLEIVNFQLEKHRYLIHSWSTTAFTAYENSLESD